MFKQGDSLKRQEMKLAFYASFNKFCSKMLLIFYLNPLGARVVSGQQNFKAGSL